MIDVFKSALLQDLEVWRTSMNRLMSVPAKPFTGEQRVHKEIKVGTRFTCGFNDCEGNPQIFEVTELKGTLILSSSVCFRDPACNDHMPPGYSVPKALADDIIQSISNRPGGTVVDFEFWMTGIAGGGKDDLDRSLDILFCDKENHNE